ncbi:MAG: glycosyltransferase [Chlorobi bacterium]|nr:glycosyltransferase [Chlorobiota bacterium]
MRLKRNYIFPYIKYVKPIWYFNIRGNQQVWTDYRTLTEEDKKLIEYDDGYSTEVAALCDAAYQILIKGIGLNTNYGKFETNGVNITVTDNYRFVRKYFNFFWAVIILIIRLLTLHNPVKEIVGFFSTSDIKRRDVYSGYKVYNDYERYKSPLIERLPKVSVIIPTLNRYEVLADVLHDFEKQDYKNFEIIVVDQSDDFREDYYSGYNLDLKVHHLTKKGVWNARNHAIRKSEGEIIALSEDDVRVEPDWIYNHLKCLCYFSADISAGVFFPEGSSVPREKSYFKLAEQFATGNAVLYKNVFKITGLFDLQFEKQRMGDGEFGLRAYLNGMKSVNNPFAYCVDVKASTGGFRDFGSWDAFRSKKLFAPKPVPSVLYLSRKYFGTKRAINFLFTNVPASVIPYRFKNNRLMGVAGMFLFVIVSPLVIFQVVLSWRKASVMLKEGAMIDRL